MQKTISAIKAINDILPYQHHLIPKITIHIKTTTMTRHSIRNKGTITTIIIRDQQGKFDIFVFSKLIIKVYSTHLYINKLFSLDLNKMYIADPQKQVIPLLNLALVIPLLIQM